MANFLGINCGRGMLLTTNPLLVPRSWKSSAILYPPSGPHRACNGITLPFFLFQRLREVTCGGKEVNMGGTRMAGIRNGINSLKIVVDDKERKRTLGRYLSGWKNNCKFNLQIAG